MLAYNMKRMINIFGVNPLMQAIAALPRACRRELSLSRNTRIENHVFTRPRSKPVKLIGLWLRSPPPRPAPRRRRRKGHGGSRG